MGIGGLSGGRAQRSIGTGCAKTVLTRRLILNSTGLRKAELHRDDNVETLISMR